MKAVVLEDVETLRLRDAPDPSPAPRDVVLRVSAVGLCGTDFHIYHGHGNYNLDGNGRQVPLREHPQILGHEFSGEVVALGREVRDLRVGDRVLCDQGRNCVSEGRTPLCAYCATGDSHQCAFYAEHGITGLPGALAELIAVPAVNCIRYPDGFSAILAALAEPLGCVLHSLARAERAEARYTFAGKERIRNILIVGAGPAGLLFLQVLRNVKRFDGLIMIADRRSKNLELARQFGGVPINVIERDLPEAVRELTHGERLHALIEASGNSIIFELMPSLLRKQATVLLYGHGHKDRDLALLNTVLFLEPTLVASVGASGGFDADGRPAIYRRALETLVSRAVGVEPYLTHRYSKLEDIPRAFAEDILKPDYIKGVWCAE